jgi:hypothetical protein
MELVDFGCMDFVSPSNYRSIVAKKCRIPICRHLQEWLEVNASI